MYMAQLSVAPLRREANGLGPLEIDRGHPHVIYSRANPTRNPVTDLSRLGYNININLTLDRITGLGIVIDNDRGHDFFVIFLHEILCVKHIRRKTSQGKIKFSAFQAHQVNA